MNIYADKPILEMNNDWNLWDGKTYRLSKTWCCCVESDKYILDITVKAGFETDGGSIPLAFQNIIHPNGIYLLSFLVHDVLYAGELLNRSQCDWIMLEMLKHQGMDWFLRNSAYLAVRCFGGTVWAVHDRVSVNKNIDLITFKYILK